MNISEEKSDTDLQNLNSIQINTLDGNVISAVNEIEMIFEKSGINFEHLERILFRQKVFDIIKRNVEDNVNWKVS